MQTWPGASVKKRSFQQNWKKAFPAGGRETLEIPLDLSPQACRISAD